MFSFHSTFQEEGVIHLTKLYRFRESLSLVLEKVGLWTSSRGLQLNDLFWRGPADFMGNAVTFSFTPVRFQRYENEKCLFSNTQEFYTGVLHNVLVTC